MVCLMKFITNIILSMLALAAQIMLTAVVLPYVSYNFDEPLTSRQKDALQLLGIMALGKATLVFVVSTITSNVS